MDGGTATGPGVFDMKAGVVQLLFALAALDVPEGVAVLLTTDEEIGSPTSRPLIEETAAGIDAALVLEPSAHGALKTARKGVSVFRVEVTGRAAHAGLDPERGVNAAVELAHQLLAIAALARPELGTTVTPSLVSGGHGREHGRGLRPRRTSTCARARATRPSASTPRSPRSVRCSRARRVAVERTLSVPPLERIVVLELFERAQRLALELGLPALAEAEVGGGSDGSVIAALGIPTLDGLGAVGDHAHGEGEFVRVDAMAERAALVAALVADLLG